MLNYYLMYIIHVTSDFFSKLKSMNERRMFLLLSRITEGKYKMPRNVVTVNQGGNNTNSKLVPIPSLVVNWKYSFVGSAFSDRRAAKTALSSSKISEQPEQISQ